MKKKTNGPKNVLYGIALVFFVLGFSTGYLVNNQTEVSPAPVQSDKTNASAQTIEQAKNEIADLFKNETVDACWRYNVGQILASGKYELSYRNLRINKSADRAIITDCGESDTLLAKDKSGQWIKTDVNLQIGNRVNPLWQKECNIEDITVADDTIRPENRTIDSMNLEECKRLNSI